MKDALKSNLAAAATAAFVLILLPAVSNPAVFMLCLPLAGIFSAMKEAFGGHKEEKRILETGEPATAVILLLQRTGDSITYGGADVRYGAELLLEIKPADGPSYQAKIVHYIPVFEIPQYQQGAVLAVKRDRQDRTKVAIVGPATPTSAQPGQEVIIQFPPGEDPAKIQEMVKQSEALSQELLVVGEPAPATVIKTEDTGIRWGVNPFYKLDLDITPKTGMPFQATTSAFIAFQSLGKFQTGSRIWVKFDPKNQTRVTLVPSSLWDKLG